MLDSKYGKGKIVICTQPRPIAAKSLANYVSNEYEGDNKEKKIVKFYKEEMYNEYFLDTDKYQSALLYMKEHDLLKILEKKKFSRIGSIIIDEAHERTVNCECILGILKKNIKSLGKTKIIITSATLNANLFQNYFYNCNVLEIPGKLYNVKTNSSPVEEGMHYTEKAVEEIKEIINRFPSESNTSNDILVFLPGKDDLFDSKKLLEKASKEFDEELEILLLYGGMKMKNYQDVFKKSPKRKVIFSTNIAESSLTIDGIGYVIDSGFQKEKIYDSTLGIHTVSKLLISKSSAKQRSYFFSTL